MAIDSSSAVTPPAALRNATPAECEALSGLAMRSKAHWGYPPAFMASCAGELRVTADALRSDAIIYRVAEVPPDICGFHAVTVTDPVTAELEALFVEPHLIGTGVGRLLMDDALGLARERGVERLVIQSDPHAEAFYLAAGAVRIGSRPSDSIAGRELPLLEFRFT